MTELAPPVDRLSEIGWTIEKTRSAWDVTHFKMGPDGELEPTPGIRGIDRDPNASIEFPQLIVHPQDVKIEINLHTVDHYSKKVHLEQPGRVVTKLTIGVRDGESVSFIGGQWDDPNAKGQRGHFRYDFSEDDVSSASLWPIPLGTDMTLDIVDEYMGLANAFSESEAISSLGTDIGVAVAAVMVHGRDYYTDQA